MLQVWGEALKVLPARDGVPTLMAMCTIGVARQEGLLVEGTSGGGGGAGEVEGGGGAHAAPTLEAIRSMAVVGGGGGGSSSSTSAAAAIGDKWPQYVIALRAWRASRQEWVEKTLAQRVHERQHMNEVRTPLPPSLPTFHLRALVLLGFACSFALSLTPCPCPRATHRCARYVTESSERSISATASRIRCVHPSKQAAIIASA